MTEQLTSSASPLTTQVALTSQPPTEMPSLEALSLLIKHRALISVVTACCTAAAVVAAIVLPPYYKADASILPPQQPQSTLMSLATGALGGLGASGGVASSLGLKNAADLYVGILKSRTVADGIVERFKLRQVYGKPLMSDARKRLTRNVSVAAGKDSIITISVSDYDPKRAADMANAYVDELYSQNSRLALTDASQRRLFFEQQLAKEKDELAKAEIALKNAEQSTGLIVPAGQAAVLIRSGAELRAEIVSREVELQAMGTYATDENPQVQLVKREIASLQSQLARVEANGSGSKFEMSGGRLPDVALEYIRKTRDLKYHETLFELLAKQYEIARIDEAKQAPVIQVVDHASLPDKRYGPPRLVIILGSLFGSLAVASGLIILIDRLKKLLSRLTWTGEKESLTGSLSALGEQVNK